MANKTLVERVGELRTMLQTLIADSDDCNEEFQSALRSADDNLKEAEEVGEEPDEEEEDEE